MPLHFIRKAQELQLEPVLGEPPMNDVLTPFQLKKSPLALQALTLRAENVPQGAGRRQMRQALVQELRRMGLRHGERNDVVVEWRGEGKITKEIFATAIGLLRRNGIPKRKIAEMASQVPPFLYVIALTPRGHSLLQKIGKAYRRVLDRN